MIIILCICLGYFIGRRATGMIVREEIRHTIATDMNLFNALYDKVVEKYKKSAEYDILNDELYN